MINTNKLNNYRPNFKNSFIIKKHHILSKHKLYQDIQNTSLFCNNYNSHNDYKCFKISKSEKSFKKYYY